MTHLRTARILMVTTMALLTVFQAYWLHKLYAEEYSNIQRNTNVIFRDCLYNLQVDRFKKDTSLRGLPGGNLFAIDMIKMLKTGKLDSGMIPGNHKERIIISINNHSDSTADGRHSLVSEREKIVLRGSGGPDILDSMRKGNGENDSLPLSTIDSAYRKNLLDARIELPFRISKINLRNDTVGCNGSFCTHVVPMGIFGSVGYRASFDKPVLRLIRSITPQIVLSLFIIGLTLLSFIFIYRNLLQQKRLSDIKNEFINNITHELKTPISTVRVAIEAIKSFNAAKDPKRTSEYLDIAENELERLTMLVDKVLKLSLLEQETIKLAFEKFDLVTLIDEVLTSMKPQLEKSQAQVHVDKHSHPIFVNADKNHISSMLFNLVDNALKYGGVQPSINIKLMKAGDNIVLSIADNGKGIPDEYKEKIFEKFFRVPHGDSHDAPGYGLGLSYVLQIIKQHKGNIEVKSIVGEGSTFIIKLPAA